jgi:ATP-dependent 26S proteasome regulatory subunit
MQSSGNLRDGLASSLLNFTDGFVGDLVRAHLVCTINSEIQDLDEAVLRPGRQRFFREFGLLNMGQATRLATVLGIALSESRSYSLAELYHHKDTQDAARLSIKNTKVIGFAGI